MESKSEKRKMPRLLNAYDVFVRAEKALARSKSRDVSPFGMGIYSDRPVNVGAPVDLSIFIMEANLNYEVQGVVRHCTGLSGSEAQKGKYLLGVEFTAGHENGLPFIQKLDNEFSQTVTQTTIIDADIKTVYRLLTSIDRFPEWVPDVKSAKVLERYPDGRCKKVEFEHMFLLLKVRYIDEYKYDDENFILSWQNAGGGSEIVNNTGAYRLKSLGPDKTAITFHINLTLSFIPSTRLLNYFTTIGVRKALKSFKAFVENEIKKH